MSTALAPARQGIPFRADPSAKARAWVESFIRAATVRVLSRLQKTSAESILRDTGWHHDSLTGLILRAPVEPLKQADVPGDSVAALMLLAPQSAAAKLFGLAVKVDLAGISSFSFPLPSNFTEAKFVIEGEPISVGQGTFAGLPLGPVRKVALIGALTGEMENLSAPVASVIIGHVLKVAVDKGLAKVLFSADAATEAAPAGLLHGVTPITAGASMSEDLSALVAAISAAGLDAESVVFVAAAEQAMAIRLAAGPLFASYRVIGAPIAPGTIIAIATDGLAVAGDGIPVVDVSKNAVLHMSDTPTDIGLPAVAPDPNVIATPAVSLFQVDAFALRCIARVTWSAAPGAVQVVNSVVW
ncbi:hypothetical protein JQ582_19880 [Bradyrhizobium japonicum]|uniref:hypothetical protein n=1 Tax=Bradyrhizobium japonicum TaxID=375 RepID=UPI001BAA54C9|nr:hypothetical protein [Bradyrhizobium japonicum]MBR0746195.1 hypothetical protein [Bradyrhizobium japonicum]